ncbi:MAG: hypothetical protein A3I75_04915 [Deltaproteobacteria bacterium RIFCSPLOWO2_02_FULL_50_16]|nr:MAG: hypothetical protein A3I75_04915 [Deltaproteobacteria bacterium RIFCSPLOWO2_02_FULL_50_16]OGQ67173.1 MAG: hypothetical protein A3F89_05225 [Deltaproteobacteria bacterium RIFCSPLOWO2_12_FULL_50_11]
MGTHIDRGRSGFLRIGRLAVSVGRWLGQKTVQGYRKIDPDVFRHLIHLPLLVFSLFPRRHNQIKPIEADGRRPLVFVPGLGGMRGNFFLIMAYLGFFGHRRSYSVDFKGNTSWEAMAKTLASFVHEVKRVTGERRVDIVAHSMGGLVVRLAIQDHNLGPSLSTLITLGTPHKGTYSARLANTSITRDLRPDSALIQRLNRHPLPRNIKVLSLWSRSELFVIPPEFAICGGSKAVEMTSFTHYSYLIHPRCWETVRQILNS